MRYFKKYLCLLFVFLLMFIFTKSVNAKGLTLDAIAEKFNSSDTVSEYGTLFDCEFNASTSDNILSITKTCDEEISVINYELNGSILSSNHLDNIDLLTAFFLADSIGQLHGYEADEVLTNFTLFSEDVYNYTVEEEGFEIEEADSYNNVKMDINKKIPLKDISEFYLKPDTFEFSKSIVEEDGNGSQSGRISFLAYKVAIDDDEINIYMGEKDGLTDTSYKSILSAIEAMYGKDAADYFQEEYPDFDEGSVMYNGFSVDVEYEMEMDEESMFSGTTVVLVTLDKNFMKDMFLRTEYVGETIERGDKTITLDFTKDEVYQVGFFDSVNASDIGFLYKYILEPVFINSNAVLDNDTAYFNIVDNKIVVGDKDNSIFKLVVKDDHFDILPTNMDIVKTTKSAIHENVHSTEYTECDYGHDHHRYGNYNVTVNVVYGNKTNYEVLNKDGLTFSFNIEYNKFLEDGKVYIDGNLVDSKNYTSKEGSTIITLNNDYVKTLSLNEHTMKVVVNDGEVETTFNLSSETTSNPQTGDNIFQFVFLLGVSIIGITLSIIYIRKELLNE